ncbi:MAG: hypothetical protein QXF09_03500 [Nitrososphaerota archaeon]
MQLEIKKILLFTIAILVILLVTSLIVFSIQLGRYRGPPHRIFPRDIAHSFGWIGAILLIISATYSALKRGFPKSIKLWLSIHCIPGILSLIFAGIHILNKLERIKPGYFLSFFTFILMVVIVVGGILGRYIKIKVIKDYWRIFHIPLTIIFYITLLLHILEKIGIF